MLLFVSFCLASFLSVLCSGLCNDALFGSLIPATGTAVLQTGGRTDYIQPDFLQSSLLFAGESAAVLLTVLISGSVIVTWKPKEILAKMS